MSKIINFTIRQFARFRFFILKFAAFFSMANFITLILILLTNMGLTLSWYWLVVVYVSVSLIGLILVFVLERAGSWDIDYLQTWKMHNKELYYKQNEYSAINIELKSRMETEELLKRQKELVDGWK